MNQFLTSTIYFITRHGFNISYKSRVVQSYNPATGTASASENTYAIKAYPKHIRANQYSFPELIGKDVVMFYIANSGLSFTPKPGDEIAYHSVVYKVTSLQSHAAQGEICLYKVVAVKG